jgi:hypothetical protein
MIEPSGLLGEVRKTILGFCSATTRLKAEAGRTEAHHRQCQLFSTGSLLLQEACDIMSAACDIMSAACDIMPAATSIKAATVLTKEPELLLLLYIPGSLQLLPELLLLPLT